MKDNKIYKWFSGLRFFVTEKRFSGEIQEAVDIAVEDVRNWDIVSSMGESLSEGTSTGTSNFTENIFDSYPDGINAPSINSKSLDVSEQALLTESDFTSVGLVNGQDPLTSQTIEQLRLQQRTSNWQYINFPIAQSIIGNIKRYVMGRGVKFDCPIPEVKVMLANFWRGNQMEQVSKELLETWLLDGEVFPTFFNLAEKKGTNFNRDIDPVLLLRTIDSGEISEVELDSDDRRVRLGYLREQPKPGDPTEIEKTYYLDVTHVFGDEEALGHPEFAYTNSKNSKNIGVSKKPRLMMIKNSRVADVRGRPIMSAVHRWNRVYLDFVYDRAILNHLRAKIYLIETRSGKTGKTTSSSVTSRRMPKGGTILVETPDRKYRVIDPQTGASGAETDIKMILYLIGSAYSMPIHILNMNAENENYASIKEAGNPFAQFIQDIQDEWSEYFKQILRFVIYQAVREGVLDSEYQVDYYPIDTIGEVTKMISKSLNEGLDHDSIVSEAQELLGAKTKQTINVFNAPLSIIFPNLIQVDPTKQAQALKIHMELGLISKFTARNMIGVDPDTEEARMASESEQEMEQAQANFDRFNNGDGQFGGTTDNSKDSTDNSSDPENNSDSKDKVTKEALEELEALAESNLDGLFWEAQTGGERSATYRKKVADSAGKQISARRVVRKALSNGTLKRPEKCPTCKEAGKALSFHHTDYRKPLEGKFLCKTCHSVQDVKKKSGK